MPFAQLSYLANLYQLHIYVMPSEIRCLCTVKFLWLGMTCFSVAYAQQLLVNQGLLIVEASGRH